MLAIYNLLTVLLIMQEMYALRHKKHKSNTGSNHGANSGSNPQGVESNTNQSRRVGADGGNSDRSSPNGVQSSRNNATSVRADRGGSRNFTETQQFLVGEIIFVLLKSLTCSTFFHA